LLGCAPSSVHRWRDARARGGEEGLRVRFSPGRPARLTAAQKRRLPRILLKGPLAHGYRTDLWTLRRIREVIRRTLGIRYHISHVARLMHDLPWSCQKPERRALERDEGEIERWKKEEWPRLKKKLRGGAPPWFSPTKAGSC
jgi:transposase